MALCTRCKGKGLCGRPVCPILRRFESHRIAVGSHKSSVFGATPPSVFIGRSGYPLVSAGPLLPPEVTGCEAAVYDSPGQWLDKSIEDIIALRSTLLRSKTRVNVRSPLESRLLERTQEIALSEKPVDAEVVFEKPPAARLRFDSVLTPMGPSGEMRRLDVAENPVVPRRVDALVSDTDVLAIDAIGELYEASISVEHITRLFSVGLLGRRRRLVPTRWSITATDDMLGKRLMERVQDYPEITGVQVYSGELFGNHFEILMFPGAYSFELAEIWMPKSLWSPEDTWVGVDGEDARGRKGYSTLGGGYYAVRLPVLEHLHRMRCCAGVTVIREVYPSYWAPLGVWVVREATRRAFDAQPALFDTVDEAMRYIEGRIRTDASLWRPELKLLERLRAQRTLSQFF